MIMIVVGVVMSPGATDQSFQSLELLGDVVHAFDERTAKIGIGQSNKKEQ